VDLLEGDYERPETLRAALAGIDRLFLISPSRLASRNKSAM